MDGILDEQQQQELTTVFAQATPSIDLLAIQRRGRSHAHNVAALAGPRATIYEINPHAPQSETQRVYLRSNLSPERTTIICDDIIETQHTLWRVSGILVNAGYDITSPRLLVSVDDVDIEEAIDYGDNCVTTFPLSTKVDVAYINAIVHEKGLVAFLERLPRAF